MGVMPLLQRLRNAFRKKTVKEDPTIKEESFYRVSQNKNDPVYQCKDQSEDVDTHSILTIETTQSGPARMRSFSSSPKSILKNKHVAFLKKKKKKKKKKK